MTSTEIKQIRESAGLKRAQAARLLGVRWSKIWEWETGKYQPSASATRLISLLPHLKKLQITENKAKKITEKSKKTLDKYTETV